MHNDIKEILISEEEIRSRTKELGEQITHDLKGKKSFGVVRIERRFTVYDGFGQMHGHGS